MPYPEKDPELYLENWVIGGDYESPKRWLSKRGRYERERIHIADLNAYTIGLRVFLCRKRDP